MDMIERVGRYRILGKLGEGGMGIVYAAFDDTLDRQVAVKMIREVGSGTEAQERFRREARAAASVNHPNVCQLYEIGEEGGVLYLAMELLEGEALSTRLERGPLDAPEASQITLAMLGALEAMHRRGFIHRDLKPSNVFLTPHGMKLLDFGLARRLQQDDQTQTALTRTGMLVGTPRYLAPEQIVGGTTPDPRVDLFSVGAILFEMLAGRPAFGGETVLQIIHAVAHEEPPVLDGSAPVRAIDGVIQRALAKRPDDRFSSAEQMANALREALAASDSDPGMRTRARAMTRLIVLPFRILRPDAETDFLAVSLADAISTSLSGLESLVVRSSVTAGRFAAEVPDLRRIATEAGVDMVLTGTLLRAGNQLRATAQLVEAPAGTVIGSHTAQMPLEDVFQLQDQLASRIVETLALPLTTREHRALKRDVPASAAAYDYFLRANQYYIESSKWPLARELYERCVEIDGRYAPAWARLGRVYRVMSKFGGEDADVSLERAEGAFRKALEINPDLSIAHNLYANLETELGRAKEAMVRLLERAAVHRADPELFAGLVHTTRYCGLLEASVAAHERARRLDPAVPTSVTFTYLMLGDLERAIETSDPHMPWTAALSEFDLGRETEAIGHIKEIELHNIHAIARLTARLYRATFESRRDEALEAFEKFHLTGFSDPEGRYLVTRCLARLESAEQALAMLAEIVENGFYCYPAMVRDPWLDPLRARPEFRQILRRAEERHREARAAFVAAGGERVLGTGVRA